MKNQLKEDIAAYGSDDLPEGWVEFDVAVQLAPAILDEVPPVNWDAVLEMADRREAAAKDMPVCEKCGTVQVQLVSWSTPTLAYRCRSCKHRFERKTK